MAQIKQILLHLKLTEKEVDILLSLIKLGKGTATIISRESGITRTHVYGLIKDLISKGLVSEVEERGIKTYEAVDHAGLLAFISREQKELQNLEKQVSQMATEFNALQVGRHQKTKVQFFDGIEGVKNIYEEIRKDLEGQTESFEVLTIFSPQNLEKILPGFTYLDYPNIVERDIVAEDALLSQYIDQIKDTKNNITFKVWRRENGLFPTDTIIWKNKIASIDLAGYASGIIVENESMVRSHTMWFNMIWKNLS